MLKLLVSFLLNFPKICEYFFKVVEAYEEAYNRNRERNADLIDEWLYNDEAPKSKTPILSRTKVHSFTAQERNHRRNPEVRE